MKRLAIRLKPASFKDEYLMTSKHLIIKYKYLVICCDRMTSKIRTLNSQQIKNLLDNQGIVFDSSQPYSPLSELSASLREWHAQIDKVVMDVTNTQTVTLIQSKDVSPTARSCFYEVNNLSPYVLKHDKIVEALTGASCHCYLPDDFCQTRQVLVDIKVYIVLTKKLVDIREMNINFQYLNRLLFTGLQTTKIRFDKVHESELEDGPDQQDQQDQQDPPSEATSDDAWRPHLHFIPVNVDL
jgi:hypothetical protein